MKVTQVFKKNENTVGVGLDNGEVLFLSLEVYLKSNLKKGSDVSSESFLFYIEQNKLYYIKQAAYRFISRRDHSFRELKTKLQKKGYDGELIASVLNELLERDYINDERFAKAFADEQVRLKKWGKRKLQGELAKKGIASFIIDEVVSNIFSDTDEEFKNAYDAAVKKLRMISHKKIEPKKQREKLLSFLIGRGYDFDTAKQAISKLDLNGEEEDEI